MQSECCEDWNAYAYEVLPIFEKYGNGKIVIIASIASIIGYEKRSAYCALKGELLR